MTYEELQKCRLPLTVINIEGKQNLLTAYNNAGFLITCKETGDWIFPWEDLSKFSLVPITIKIALYKYNIFDKARQEKFQSKWTTESFQSVYPQNGNFELTSTEKKIIEVEV